MGRGPQDVTPVKERGGVVVGVVEGGGLIVR